MSAHLRFSEGTSDYEDGTDSDEDYTENEKRLLTNVRNRRREFSDSEEEVYGVGSDGAEDDASDIAASDVDQQDDDDIPDAKAWGKDKRRFYATDFADKDTAGSRGAKDGAEELDEQEEAGNLHKLLAEEYADDDFFQDVEVEGTKEEEEEQEEAEKAVKVDISKLTRQQQKELLRKECPLFFKLVEDYKVKMTTVRDYLYPILAKHRKGEIKGCPAIDFVQSHYEMIMNYGTNVYMFLVLKASQADVNRHPVINRLKQYRQVLNQIDPVFEEKIKPQVEVLLTDDKAAIPQKTLDRVRAFFAERDKCLKSRKAEGGEERPPKKVKFDDGEEAVAEESDSEGQENEEAEGAEAKENGVAGQDETEPGKRAITYQMAKNKGLTPYRKKELRNPRVKHRIKFKKAKVRRKGAVREHRPEITRYGGEISGINASVSRSVKFK